MEIFHISAECYPVAKVGGLADVVGALPKYLNKLGQNAKVVLPAYQTKFTKDNKFISIYKGNLALGNLNFDYSILKEEKKSLGFELYLIEINGLLDRPGIYSYHDETERFVAFQIAFLNWLTETNKKPDIIHCHDHHTGLIPFMIKYAYNYGNLKNTPTVITIHNAQYQGWFGFNKLNYLPNFDYNNKGYLEWDGYINPLASAIKCAWKVTTVSPSYLDEICEKANGLENLLRSERNKSVGILNGIDTEVWDPTTDEYLDHKFSLTNFFPDKKLNKKFLCEQFDLNINKPLFTFIGRFVSEKGADLLPNICRVALNSNPREINILILGSGDSDVENKLQELKNYYQGYYNSYIGFNEKLAHIIYAGADFLLMPSRVEPCGLNQMYAMRYGTIPIVRKTGGLKDTVRDFGDGGFGICHDNVEVNDINNSITRAIDLYYDNKKFNSIRIASSKIDHSWEKVAEEYINLYKNLKK